MEYVKKRYASKRRMTRKKIAKGNMRMTRYKTIKGIRNVMHKTCTYDTSVNYTAGGTGMTWPLTGAFNLGIYQALANTLSWTNLIVPNIASGEEYTFNRFKVRGAKLTFAPTIPQGGTITQPFYIAVESNYSQGDVANVVYNILANDNKGLFNPYPYSNPQSKYFAFPARSIGTNYSNVAAQPYLPSLSSDWQDVKSVQLNSSELPGMFCIATTFGLISTVTRAGTIHIEFYVTFADFD